MINDWASKFRVLLGKHIQRKTRICLNLFYVYNFVQDWHSSSINNSKMFETEFVAEPHISLILMNKFRCALAQFC